MTGSNPAPHRRRPHTMVHAFADSAKFAGQVARAAGLRVAEVGVHRFPDGETVTRVATPPGAHAVLVRSLHDPNPKLFETLMAADALRRAGALRVTLVAPYLPYMRQDRVFQKGEPISQRVIGQCLGRAFDGLLTIDPHLHRVRKLSEIVRCRARPLGAAPAIADWIIPTANDCVVVGPDEESGARVEEIALRAGLRFAVGRKRRLGDRRVTVSFDGLAPASRAVVVDDIASSGGTLAAAVGALRSAGFSRVETVVVHPIFAPGALARIRAAGARKIVSCDTIPHPTNAIGVAALVAEALGTMA